MAIAVMITRTETPDIIETNFHEELVGLRALKTTYTPTIVENSARNFMNPLNGNSGSCVDMLSHETMLVIVPEGNPNKK